MTSSLFDEGARYSGLGAKKATDDFAAQMGVAIQSRVSPQVYIVKP